MVIENITGIDLVQPLTNFVQPFLLKISLLVGGIFGLYLILILVRIHYERKKVKILQDIRYNLDQANIYHNIRSSKQKKGIFKRTYYQIKNFLSKKLKR